LANSNSIETEPARHGSEFAGEFIGDVDPVHAILEESPRNPERPRLAISFQIDSRDEVIAQQEGEYVVPVDPLRLGNIDLDPVVKVMESFDPVPIPHVRVERIDQGPGPNRTGNR
jgi:hypothetical protein